MYCGKCGKPNEDGATVCANCGAELKPATFIPPAPPSAAEPAEGNTPPAQNADANAAPAQNADANAVPPQNSAPNAMPPQNFGPNAAPPQNFGPNAVPPQNFGPNGAPPQNFGPNGAPPQNFGPNGAPPQNFGPNGMPPQNFGAYAAPAQGPKKPNPVIEKMKPVLEKAKTLPKAVFIGAGAGLVALIVLICVLAAAGKTINLDKYLTIETTGYNGYGEATATIDWARMEKECSKKISFSQKAKNNALVRTFSTPFYVFRECVGLKLDKYKDLSNGDEINYTWSISSEMELYLNCKVKYTNGKKKVSDLTEVETFDAFADVQVEFSGSAPAGTAELKYSGDMLSAYDFSMDKNSGLSNGDVITVTLSDYVQNNCLSKYGKVPAEKSKEYTVSGLSEYVGAFKDLPEDFIAKVKSEAEDTISAYCANDYNESSSMTGLTYAGYALNLVKPDVYTREYNSLYIIYKGTVSSSENLFPASTVYFPVQFVNVQKTTDGVAYEEKNGIQGSSSLGGSYGTKGFVNPLTCYIDLVVSAAENYTSECGDGFEAYAEYDVISALADISDTYKETLRAEAKDKIAAYIAETYRDSSVAEAPVFKGEYLLTAKEQGRDFAKNNRYFVVFAVNVSSTENNFAPATVYFPVEFSGIVKLPGDEYMVYEKGGIVGHSDFPDSTYYTDGYLSGATMFSEIVTANREQYKYEVSEGLKEFGE